MDIFVFLEIIYRVDKNYIDIILLRSLKHLHLFMNFVVVHFLRIKVAMMYACACVWWKNSIENFRFELDV